VKFGSEMGGSFVELFAILLIFEVEVFKPIGSS
jgi:hypothetical protein